jgi:hypothetical protein
VQGSNVVGLDLGLQAAGMRDLNNGSTGQHRVCRNQESDLISAELNLARRRVEELEAKMHRSAKEQQHSPQCALLGARGESHPRSRSPCEEKSSPGSPTERNAMRTWKYLLSLVKAKLLSNKGRGRKITILCGGLLSQTYEETLRRYPGTLLTSMITDDDGLLFYSDKVIIDRHPIAFVEILNAYREGVISEQPLHIAHETWINELMYFQMHRANIPAIKNLFSRYGIHVTKVIHVEFFSLI